MVDSGRNAGMRRRSGFHDLDRTLEEVRRAKGTLDTAAIMKRIFKGRVERVKMKKMIEKKEESLYGVYEECRG